jgi:hypothetical protein
MEGKKKKSSNLLNGYIVLNRCSLQLQIIENNSSPKKKKKFKLQDKREMKDIIQTQKPTPEFANDINARKNSNY